MKRLTVGLALVIALSSVSLAKDICVSSSVGGNYVFKKVKKVKPGGAVAVNGLWILATAVAPVSGTAVGKADGSVQLGLQAFALLPIFGVNFTIVIAGADPETFARTGSFENENDADNGEPDGVITFTSVDCDTLTVP